MNINAEKKMEYWQGSLDMLNLNYFKNNEDMATILEKIEEKGHLMDRYSSILDKLNYTLVDRDEKFSNVLNDMNHIKSSIN